MKIKKFEEFENLNESFKVGSFEPIVSGGTKSTRDPFSYDLALKLPNPTGNDQITTEQFQLKVSTKVPVGYTGDFQYKVKRRINDLKNDIKQAAYKYQEEVDSLIEETIEDLKQLDDPEVRKDELYQDYISKLTR